MARINTAQLLTLATLADRAHQVAQDPAVQKACSETGDDITNAIKSIAKATKSIAKATKEIGQAWLRLGPDGGAAPIPVWA